MKLTIKITKEVLKKTMMCGVNPNDIISQNCAVSYAIREIFPDAQTVYSEIDTWIGLDRKDRVMRVSPEAAAYIMNFDLSSPKDRLSLPEFSFTIDVPDSVIESIGIEEAKTIIEKSSTLELA